MSGKPRRILVSNDDGYFSEGLQALVEAVSPLGEVWVVAPDREQSAASHAISLHRPLRIKEVRTRWFAVDGTPADCAYLAINHLLKDDRPVLMVSGINHGANLAEDIMYSGTVAAAMEARSSACPPSPSASWPGGSSTSRRGPASPARWWPARCPGPCRGGCSST